MANVRSLCGDAFERIGQMFKLNTTTEKKMVCPHCGKEFTIKAEGVSGKLNFNVNPGSLSPWK